MATIWCRMVYLVDKVRYERISVWFERLFGRMREKLRLKVKIDNVGKVCQQTCLSALVDRLENKDG